MADGKRTVTQSPQFRPDIEGLRAIAVLLVVACHAGIPGCSGGFIGVDVFFVLSGYLITGLLLAELRATSRLQLARFYARRARRLLPALLLVLLTTLAVGLLVQVPQELDFTARAARATALYVSNVFFDHNAADYFAPDVQSNPLLHTWSLGVEEQFYLFWPLLLILGVRIGGSARALKALLSAVVLGSFLFCVWSTYREPTVAFYELPPRAWEFAIGGLLAMLGMPQLGRWTWIILGWTGLAAILLASFLIPDGADFPGWRASVPALGTVAVLAAGSALPGGGACVLLERAIMQYLGRRSYSWYLWHWPFIVFSASVAPSISLVGKVVVAIGSLGAAALTYRFLEWPVRHNLRLVSRTALSLRLAAATAVATAALAWLVLPVAERMAHQPFMTRITAAVADIAEMPRQECATLGRSTRAQTCTFGDATSPTTVVLFGDSHAIEWFNALQLLARQEHWRLVTVVKTGCAASEIDDVTVAQTQLCRTWRTNALDAIVRLRPSLVFVASFSEWFGRARNRPNDPALERLQVGTKATLQRLSRAGLRVLLLRDTPFPPFNVPTCLARSALHPWLARHTCEFDRADALNPAVFVAQQAAVAGVERAALLDVSDQFCDASVCPAMLHDMIVYRDENHLTGRFASSLAPAVAARLAAMSAGR
jgi:peptidoglycan/LPS O-acetylase OafA/YrhL